MATTVILLVSDADASCAAKNVFYVSSDTYLALDPKKPKSIPVWLCGEMNTTIDIPAWIKESSTIVTGSIAGNAHIRTTLGMRLGAKIAVRRMDSYDSVPEIGTLHAEVFKSGPEKVTVDGDAFVKELQRSFDKHFIVARSLLHLNMAETVFAVRVTAIDGPYGRMGSATQFKLTVASQSKDSIVMSRPASTSTAGRVVAADFTNLAVGGMDAELKIIVERLLASRLLSPAAVARMGVNHVRGVLFYGPPGCGKTLIARELAKVLKAHPPKIVNGPELLSKWVGSSEENVRALFKEAEEEQRTLGEESQLHVIILDELDALCRKRGSSSDGTGVHDNIVNQLLSKIDGVEPLNNVIIIGMTNRRELLDEALLRPGRLELQIEIGLPDEAGRLQICKLHTAALAKNGYLARDVDLEAIAAATKNYTGAELEGLVRTARSSALSRCIDSRRMIIIPDRPLLITQADFMDAISVTKPAFGSASDIAMPPHGFIKLSSAFDECVDKMQKIIDSDSNHIVLGIGGERGCGATTVAQHLATTSKMPYIRMITADKLLSMRESERVGHIMEVFNGAERSDGSVVIIDDMEACIEYIDCMPVRYNASIVHAINVMLTRAVEKRLIVVVTHPVERLIKKHAFNALIELPLLEPEDINRVVGITEAMVPTTVKHMFAIMDLAKKYGWTTAEHMLA